MKWQHAAVEVMAAILQRVCTTKSSVLRKIMWRLETAWVLNLNWKAALTPREERGEIVRDGRTERLLTEGKTHISVLLLLSMETPESAEHTHTHTHTHTRTHWHVSDSITALWDEGEILQPSALPIKLPSVCVLTRTSDSVHVRCCCVTRVYLGVWLHVPVCMFNRRGVCIWVLALMASRCAARASEAWRLRVYVCVCVCVCVCVSLSDVTLYHFRLISPILREGDREQEAGRDQKKK